VRNDFPEKLKVALRNELNKRRVFERIEIFRSNITEFKFPVRLLYELLLKIRARLFNLSLIHVIGDSHVKSYVMKSPFIVHHIYEATAHNIDKINSSSRSKQQIDDIISRLDRKRDVVLMVFGEIDARIHIYYQHEKQGKKKSINQLIDDTVADYMGKIARIKDSGIDTCVYGITPASRMKENTFNYPFYGTPDQRSRISRSFNEKLKNDCQRRHIPFIDIQSVAATEDGFIKDEYRLDEIHLNTRIVPFTRNAIEKAFEQKRKFA